MARREELTDEQWAIIAPLIPEPPRREDGRGRPWKESREVKHPGINSAVKCLGNENANEIC
jgi:transposase